MGVRRAVELAVGKAKHPEKIYTLGPLIHNPRVLEDLKRMGVKTLDSGNLPEDLNGISVIIPAHGISPQMEAELYKRGARLIDATCPKVKASQLKAADLAKAGYRLFLAGEKSHAELVGIRSYAETANGRCIVVGNAREAGIAAEKLRAENPEPGVKTALIGQTTISAEEYLQIGRAIIRVFADLQIAQTICAATIERQDSLRELLKTVDAVIVAGGKESANTLRLLAIAETSGKPCVLVETQADIPPHFYGFDSVGLAAGASTPDTVIDEIEEALVSG